MFCIFIAGVAIVCVCIVIIIYANVCLLTHFSTSTDQIKAEREREEFDKLAKKQTIGDRGTNWMYEGHGVSGQDELQSAAAAASEAKAEEAKNESYLLGKEYVPDNQIGKGSGDFAAVSNMSGALEKASTVGATIGVGQSTNNNVAAAVGGGEGSTLRIQQQTNIQKEDNNSEWNQNFHLRHEDPMFAVSQQKRQIDKDVEKKRKLMERAGLDVRPVLKKDGDRLGNKKMRDERYMSDGDKRRHKKKKKRKHKSKKSRKSHHKSSSSKRRRRDRSRSPSYSSDYSSSSYVSSRGRRHHDSRKHRGGDRYESRHRRRSRSRSADRHDSREDDRRRHHSHRRSRSRSYSPRDRRRRRHSSRSYSRSRSRDDSRNRREYDGDRKKRERDEYKDRSYNGHNNHDDRKPPPADASSSDHQRAKDDDTNNTKKKAEGYGLIGTSLANRNNASSQQQKHDYLGPNQKLLAAKRDEIEQERRLRLEAAGRSGGGDYDEFGRSRPRSKEERERALKEMERTARDRR